MYIKRKLEDKIYKYLNSPEVIAILGPRQCGKTTLLKKVSSGLKKANFISFEDQAALNLFNRDIDDFISLYVKNFDYLFIDEFQYAKNGGKRLKYIFDTQRIKIFISGLSAIDLAVNAIKYLVGRIFIFNLYPLDFEEFLSYKDANLNEIRRKLFGKPFAFKKIAISEEIQKKFKKDFEEFVIYGGYPRVVISADNDERKEVLKNIYNTFFLREVRDILGLIDNYKLDKLIKGLALQTGNLIEYIELGNLSEFSYPTLKRYLNFLEKTFICRRILPFHKNKRTEIVKNPKIFFIDSGLRNQIVNDFRPASERGDYGALLENAVFSQLAKKDYAINYWRDKNKNKVDFILEMENQKKIALEVKNKVKGCNSSVAAFKKNYPDFEIFFSYLEYCEKAGESGVENICIPAYLV